MHPCYHVACYYVLYLSLSQYYLCNTKHTRAVLLRILLEGAEGGGVVSKHTGAAAHVLGGQVRKRTRHE